MLLAVGGGETVESDWLPQVTKYCRQSRHIDHANGGKWGAENQIVPHVGLIKKMLKSATQIFEN